MENTTRTPADTYAGDLKKAEDGLRSVQRRIYRTGTLRLLLFAATIAAIVAARSEGWGTVAAIAVTGTALFLLLVKLHNRLFARKEYLEKLTGILEKNPETVIKIDLGKQTVSAPGAGEYRFEINGYKKECLMKGYSDIDYLLSDKESILRYEESHDRA